jgi:hypothetical protein
MEELKEVGGTDTGGRYWPLYRGPFTPPPARTLWSLAHRLGFRASADVACPT